MEQIAASLEQALNTGDYDTAVTCFRRINEEGWTLNIAVERIQEEEPTQTELSEILPIDRSSMETLPHPQREASSFQLGQHMPDSFTSRSNSRISLNSDTEMAFKSSSET